MANASAVTGKIVGRVFDASTREPLISAVIMLLDSSRGTTTDENGTFELAGLVSGSYVIRATYLGYEPLLKADVMVAAGRPTELVLAMTPSAVNLAEIVVQNSYFDVQPQNAVSSQTLSSEEIRRSPGGQEDVIRAVSVLPGVVRVSAGRNDLIVRGGAPSENLYTIDDLEVPNINHFGTQGAAGGPLSFVNLDFVRDVTFSTGGFGVAYGDKLSSVMNIDLKDGRSDRLGGKATLSATQFGMNAEGPIGNGSFLLSARRSYLDYFFRSAGFGFVPEYWDFLGKTTHRLSSRDEVSVLAIGVLDHVRFFNDTEDQRYDNSRILGSSQNQYFSRITWRHLFRGGVLTTAIGRTYTAFDYSQADSSLQTRFASQSREGQTSLRTDGLLRLSETTEWSFGIISSAARLTGDLQLTDPTTDFGDTLSMQSSSWDYWGYKGAVYSQVSQRLRPSFRVSAGVRSDYFDRIAHPWNVAPRLSARWQATQRVALSLSGGVYFQAPSYIWLTSNPDNRRLRHLRSDQIVAGIEYLPREDTRFRVESYIKCYRNYPASLDRSYLVLANTGAGFGGSEEGYASFGFDPLVSNGKGLSRGVELLLQKRFSEVRCYGIVSVAFSRTEFAALDGVMRRGLFDQPLIAGVSGGYKPNDNWEFSMKFRVASGTPFTPFEADGMRDASRFNTARLPVAHGLDFRADRHWNFDGWNLITYIDLQNVYAQKTIEGYRWNSRIQAVETNTSLGILPSIGISAEF